jgi:hypothetical protein
MSTGRYSQRGWAFQSFAFRTWGLAGAVEATTQRVKLHSLRGTSIQAIEARGTAMQSCRFNGTSEQYTELIGTQPE